MVLGQVFSPKSVILNLESVDKDELFEEMLESCVALQPTIDRKEALAALRDRESKMSTGIMHDIAVPHGNVSSATGVVGAIGISRRGIDYDALDGCPVHVVFMLICSPDAAELHLKVLKELAAILQNPVFIRGLVEKKTCEEVYDLVCQNDSAI